VSVTALRDAQNTIIGYLLIGTDNTARKQVDDRLRAASQYARSLIEASLDPLVTISSEGKITDVNAGSVKVTGVPREKLIGTDFSDYFTAPDKAREGYQQVFAKGFVTDYPLTIRHEDGGLTDVLYNASVYKDVQGNVLGVFAAARDITERNQVEAERQQLLLIQEKTNEQLQQADAVIATDARACVTLMNPLAEHLTGWTQAQAAGHPINEVFRIISQETRQSVTVPVVETLAHGTVQGLANHTIVIARDGRECAIADSCAPIRNRDGEVVGAVLVFRDVTEEYAVQQALHDKNVELESARDVAEKANLAKSDFLSSMSHELRTPLNAILGFTQLMESASPPPTPPQKRSLDQILTAGWYLLELINEILDLALIESGTATLSHEPVSLVEVMLECRTMIEPQAEQRGIAMTFPRFEGPCVVSADRTRVKQVLINLLFNAVKYNRPKGSVAVEYSLISPTSIRISVRDSGEGLDATQMGQLFQPFNRLGREASVEEGTGIGLMVTKRLVELMGGTIGVESTVGVGSVFWFELNLASAPLHQPGEAERLVPVRLQVPEGTPVRTVLYVEDNPANLELVEQLIARRPELRLLSAADGILGVEFARAYQPHVILMDINLPGISGLEAMRRLRADPATAHIPVIALSANAVPRDIEKALEAGFLSYLTKPIKVNQFMEALDAALLLAPTGPGRAAEKVPA
jgi:PAS domain S-box-containing protein